jgi:hypothetical protein
VSAEVTRLLAVIEPARRSGRITLAQERAALRLESLLLEDLVGGPVERGPEDGETPTAAAAVPTRRETPPRLEVEVVWGDLTKVEADVYAVGHYYGVRPQNAVAALDREVSRGLPSGLIADHVKRGLVRAELGTVSFFPWGRRTIAIAGMGHTGTFSEPQLRALARSLTWAVANVPGARVIGTVLIGSGEGNLDVARAVRGMFRGMVEAFAEGPVASRVRKVLVIERRRDRALEIRDTLLAVAGELAADVTLLVRKAPRARPGGVVGREEALALLAGAAAKALAGRKGRPQVAGLLRRVEGVASILPKVTAALDGLALGPAEIRIVSREGGGQATDFPTRITFAGDPKPYRVAAITNTAVVPERPLGIDPALVRELIARTLDPAAEDAASLGDLVRRLLVPGDFEWLLRTGGPYVFEVDREMAAVNFELLGVDGVVCPTTRPLAVESVLARQLRTVYSAPPSPAPPPEERLRALVIGDPGDPERGESLPGARREALRVVEVLQAHGVDVTVRIGAPGVGEVGSHPPADRLDCLHLLMKGGFHVLHYAGHGDFDEDNSDRVGWVFKSGLLTAREMERLAAPPLLVVANACLSARTSVKGDRPDLLPSLADEFFRRGVRDYVGTAWEVNDEGASLFAETFYESLLATPAPPLGEAVRVARCALFDRRAVFGSLWAAYQHYGDPATRLQATLPAKKKARSGKS